MGLNKK
jgi:hypothetical protein